MTTMTINNEKNGIELKFDKKPIAGTLDVLKQNGFRWHSQKELWYAKITPERQQLAHQILNLENYADKIRAEEQPEKQKKQPVNALGVQIGDVFYYSWGYEQTNIDYYQVVDLRGKTQIILREISHEGRSIGFCSQMVKPIRDAFVTEETIRKTVKGTKEHPYCSMEYGLLHKTDWETEHNETSYY